MSDSDIFREIDQEMRRDQMQALWDKFGNYIVGGALAIIGIVGGYQWWTEMKSRTAAETGVVYSKVAVEKAEGKAEDATKTLQKLAANGPAGYAGLARLSLAASKAAEGNTDEAVVKFDKLAHDSSVDSVFRDFARLQAAQLRVEKANVAEMENRLEPLLKENSGWRFSARELLGLALYKAGDYARAEKVLTKIIVSPAAPANLKARADNFLQVVTAAQSKAESEKAGTESGKADQDGKKAPGKK